MIFLIAAAVHHHDRPAAAAAPFAYQGVAVGAEQSEVRQTLPGMTCSTADQITKCKRNDAQISGIPIEANYAFSERLDGSNRLFKIDIYFPYRAYDDVMSAIRGKYGEPKTIGQISYWSRGHYKISLKEPFPGDYGFAIIADDVESDRLQKAEDKSAASQF